MKLYKMNPIRNDKGDQYIKILIKVIPQSKIDILIKKNPDKVTKPKCFNLSGFFYSFCRI